MYVRENLCSPFNPRAISKKTEKYGLAYCYETFYSLIKIQFYFPIDLLKVKYSFMLLYLINKNIRDHFLL